MAALLAAAAVLAAGLGAYLVVAILLPEKLS